MHTAFQTLPTLALDHVIHVVRDPEVARRRFERAAGVHTVPGGVHPAWGTWNTLAYFGLSYIEWLGVQDPAVAAHSTFGRNALNRLAMGEGASQFALRTRQMDELAAAWQRRGLSFTGPVEASRKRPDGSELRWRMLFPEQLKGAGEAGGPALLPFVIEWGEDDRERLAELRTSGALQQDIGLELAAVYVATSNPLTWMARYGEHFGVDLADDGTTAGGAGSGTRGASVDAADGPREATTNEFWQADVGSVQLRVADLATAGARAGAPGDVLPGVCQLDFRRGRVAAGPSVAEEEFALAGLRVRICPTE
ncbi:MAG: VOC family protein [Alicyclobacillus sp.]|nr:VOC family protein [Alicyclobacillus sp.]